MLRHVSTSIDGLLKKDDQFLGLLFEGTAAEIRKELEERKAAGEILVGSENCQGFCPINGCPGHKNKEA